MYMRIVWGKIIPGKWNEFEAAFKAAMAKRGEVTGLKNHWSSPTTSINLRRRIARSPIPCMDSDSSSSVDTMLASEH